MALELLSQLYIFENSTECSKISFDSDSFQNRIIRLRDLAEFPIRIIKQCCRIFNSNDTVD